MQKTPLMHNQTIIDQFSQQAIPFAELPGHSQAMQILIEMSDVSGADTVLDVACGPGLVACEFALYADHVTGIDITSQMIEQAKKRQQEKSLTNLTWQIGDVLPLPFPDSQFSIVLTRYTFHHFLNPRAVLNEMIRVCQPGGRVIIVDVVQRPENVEAFDQLEKLRDPSHVHALTFHEINAIIADSGLVNIKTTRYKFEEGLEQLLKASFPNLGDEEKIREIFRLDLELNRRGINAHLRGSEIHFAFPILAIAGSKTVRDG
ncbi:type 11 methyltransferase [Candidatus Nitrosoglobus terrae]|uniref:Type 11 methyltransferase n=1 Tax=Candidatus Nitrosoglobus terrae TaxID=1630141 RepID=A0A1Q2SKM6_9GAMM|nr:methyltransferase domain-containing protein [Candidatus Nitrosoglobus terrae]BAW79705.1 type 11 methyltransferase [Candidatus Nitrosoglobus terrae]